MFVDAIHPGRPPSGLHHGQSQYAEQLGTFSQQSSTETRAAACACGEVMTESQLQTYRSGLVALLRQGQALYRQTYPTSVSGQKHQLPVCSQSRQQSSRSEAGPRFVCRVTSCKEVFAADSDRGHHEWFAHSLTSVPVPQRSHSDVSCSLPHNYTDDKASITTPV